MHLDYKTNCREKFFIQQKIRFPLSFEQGGKSLLLMHIHITFTKLYFFPTPVVNTKGKRIFTVPK